MIHKNQLMLSVAFAFGALGLIWFRCKKIHCDSGGSNKKTVKLGTATEASVEQTPQKSQIGFRDLKQTLSMPIGRSTPAKNALNSEDSLDFKFGKSAPIDITPNKTSPTRSSSKEKAPLDSDLLKTKIEEIDQKALNSIEEHSFESVDLPGSVGCRRRFSFTTIITSEPPVVIKANTSMAAKTSPSSSFAEVPTTPYSEVEPMALEVNTADTPSGDESQTRALPVSSPPLSLCSNKSRDSGDSGDSGKGSSPPNSEGGQPSPTITSYDFELSSKCIGALLGKRGSRVQSIIAKTGANILVRPHPESEKLQVCTVEGTQTQIDAALVMIKSKLPKSVCVKRVVFDVEKKSAAAQGVPTSPINSTLLQVCYLFESFSAWRRQCEIGVGSWGVWVNGLT